MELGGVEVFWITEVGYVRILLWWVIEMGLGLEGFRGLIECYYMRQLWWF